MHIQADPLAALNPISVRPPEPYTGAHSDVPGSLKIRRKKGWLAMAEQSTQPDRRAFLGGALAAVASSTLAASRTGAAHQAGPEQEARAFLKQYTQGWLPLEKAANEASWTALTDVSETHTQTQAERNLDLSRYVGQPEFIQTLNRLLAVRDKLEPITVRQLEKARLRAAEAPGTRPELVEARARAEAEQSAAQDGYRFLINRKGTQTHVSANQIDQILIESRELDERLAAWNAAKAIGAPLRPGLLKLRHLRNTLAQAMGFTDFFALQVADYGLTVPEMLAICDTLVADVEPLYKQLHAWAGRVLADRYHATLPDDGKIPAHWLPNRWGQNWPQLVSGIDMDAPFKGRPKEYIPQQAERFYQSLGFPKLPDSFWKKSDLYPVDAGSSRRKNSHASAWHIDLEADVRSLMSIEPDSRWFTTAHHELGHIYYDLSYATPRVPYLLRAGANRAFHEGIGDLISLAASQRPYLKQVGLLDPAAEKADPISFLLDAALDGASVVFIPFSAGVMTHFEHDFYAGAIPDDQLNAAWWKLAARYQGMAPPGDRPETLCDPATKTHINDDPAQYYDYAIGTAIKFQLHDHITRVILKQDPHNCNYYGDRRVGEFLRGIFALGATRDWNSVLLEATGQKLSARAITTYFDPLAHWLKKQNEGHRVGWT